MAESLYFIVLMVEVTNNLYSDLWNPQRKMHLKDFCIISQQFGLIDQKN